MFAIYLCQFLSNYQQSGANKLETIHRAIQKIFKWFKGDSMGIETAFMYQIIMKVRLNIKKVRDLVDYITKKETNYTKYVPVEYWTNLKKIHESLLSLNDLIVKKMDPNTNHGVVLFPSLDRTLKEYYRDFNPKKHIKKSTTIKFEDKFHLNNLISSLVEEKNINTLNDLIINDDNIKYLCHKMRGKISKSRIVSHIYKYWTLSPKNDNIGQLENDTCYNDDDDDDNDDNDDEIKKNDYDEIEFTFDNYFEDEKKNDDDKNKMKGHNKSIKFIYI